MYRLITDNFTSHSGKNSAFVSLKKPSANASNVQILKHNIPFEKSKTYTLKFWAKLDVRDGRFREFDLVMQAMDNPVTILLYETVILDSIDWKEYVYTFKAPDDYNGKIWLGLWVGLSDIDFWIDDIRFFEGEPSDEIGNIETIKKLLNKILSSASWGGIKRP
ncbi:TPA: hypothetical protein ENS27_01320 [bacterium]|nr:hypothetical protein [bacterium]